MPEMKTTPFNGELTSAAWIFGAVEGIDDLAPEPIAIDAIAAYIAANIDLSEAAFPFANLTGLPSTLSGHGITNAYTKTEVDSALALKANTSALAAIATSGLFADLLSKPTTLAGYGISDAYTQSQVDSALAFKADLASPALTGNPTAPTQSAGNSTTRLATTEFVSTAIGNLIGAAPGLLDTLDEIANALGDDPNFATTITTALAGKLAIDQNLADVQDAEQARVNLGLELGVQAQEWSANLDAWSLLATSAKQNTHANLTAFAGLTFAANKLAYLDSSAVLSLTDFTTLGRTLAGLADAAAGRTALGLGTAAVENIGTSGANVPKLSAQNTWGAIQEHAAGFPFYLHNQADQTTNYERARFGWNANVLELLTEKGGTGSNRAMTVGTGSGSGMSFAANGSSMDFLISGQSRMRFIGNAGNPLVPLSIGGFCVGQPATPLGQSYFKALSVYADSGGSAHQGGADILTAVTLLSVGSGATAVATGLIPAGSFVLGVTTRIGTALNGGVTGYQVGDGSDADRWGAASAATSGTKTGEPANNPPTANPTGYYQAAGDVVLTPAGAGSFGGTGAVRIIVTYLRGVAPVN